MKYLLDVNALIALAVESHVHHQRMETWVASLQANEAFEILTSALTELGFVRVLSQVPFFQMNVESSRAVLVQMKGAGRVAFRLVADDPGADRLPAWVKTARQTSDGHLAELAASRGAELVTLDEGIPGAFLVPVIPSATRT